MLLLALMSGGLMSFVAYRVLFQDRTEFFECVKFWLTPDVVSMFRGQYWEDRWAELKLVVWLGVSVGVGYGVYNL